MFFFSQNVFWPCHHYQKFQKLSLNISKFYVKMARMCLISVPNLKEIHPGEVCFFLAQSCCKSVQRTKIWRKSGNFQKLIFQKLHSRFPLNLVCQVVYMEITKYVNLIEIGPVVIEIWGVENGDLAVPVNNTLVCRMSFLAADTQPCVLMPLGDYSKAI